MAQVIRKPTVVDVARVAQVSTATVSRVLNGRRVADPELVHRVRLAAAELNYRPSGTARSLKAGVTRLIGVVVPDLGNPSFSELLRGLADATGAQDHRLLVADAKESQDEERTLIQELALHCDGLVLCSPRLPLEDLAQLVATPMVCTNREVGDLSMSSAGVDSYAGMTAVVHHLAGLGHRHLGYLAGPPTSWSNAERQRAFEDTTASLRLPRSVVQAGSTSDDGHRTLPALLAAGVSGVIAFNDLVAIGALARLREQGLDVPGDISLAGFDDIPVAEFLAPPLTTVRLPTEEVGRHAWALLREQLERAGRHGTVRLPTELVVRASTGAATRA
ncbi:MULTISPECIES: LacI family DNA-binding transcriptional regulator [unclassified Streptomyces]|uniref:LacI family DNA-binding transcriptional regulator n=1 Tax=unclassified Streptomyces TaxID=2593676 RepID=UPI002E334D87|nr:LacI family DNA-binding transcriptional regulator [Streptomyces sp. NBC_01280]WSE12168.1 LacI family transcriptional regulator [Streptomyces sp. NBC_01397]WSE19461.1 LacI family transcriptional regulator [Streptomyces sp. NBC_01397]